MLLLSRKHNESVVVGGIKYLDRVFKVTVLEISSSRVTLGFEADEDVPVHRSEVWERIRASSRPERPTAGAVDRARPRKPRGRALMLSGRG